MGGEGVSYEEGRGGVVVVKRVSSGVVVVVSGGGVVARVACEAVGVHGGCVPLDDVGLQTYPLGMAYPCLLSCIHTPESMSN